MDSLTPAEDYALWGARVNCLFRNPTRYCGTDADIDIRYQRMYDNTTAMKDIDPKDAQVTPSTPVGSSESTLYNTYYDEDAFPFCFYARMLRGAPPAMPAATTPSTLQTRQCGRLYKSTISDGLFSSVSQRHYVDEAELTDRIAVRLRRQATEKRRALAAAAEYTRYDLQGPAPSFLDPKVEAVQATLMEEMTSLLMDVRRRNAAAQELRNTLVRSRALRERTEGGGEQTDHFHAGAMETED